MAGFDINSFNNLELKKFAFNWEATNDAANHNGQLEGGEISVFLADASFEMQGNANALNELKGLVAKFKDIPNIANEWLEKFSGEPAVLDQKNPFEAVTPPKVELPSKYLLSPPQHEPFEGKGYTEPDEENKGNKVNNGDGTVTEYDKNGYIQSIKYTFPHPAAGKDKISIIAGLSIWETNEYDYSGNITRTIHYQDSSPYIVEYEYDDNNNVARSITRDADGELIRFRDFKRDGNGNITREIEYNADRSMRYWVELAYDDNGEVTRYLHRNSDGSMSYLTELDDNGNVTREITHDSHGTRIDREYDVNGNVTRKITHLFDGSFMDEAIEYYSNGKKRSEKTCYDDGMVMSHEYDVNGNVTREIEYNADGSVKGWTVFEKDVNGKSMHKHVVYNADGIELFYQVFRTDEWGGDYWDVYKPDGTRWPEADDWGADFWNRFKPDGTPWEDE